MTLIKEISIHRRDEKAPRIVRVEVTIDEERLALNVGRKAGYNRTGKAQVLRGAIKAKVLS